MSDSNGSVNMGVNTCHRYFKAKEEGLAPVKEFERSAYNEFSIMCEAGKLISESKPSATSYVDGFSMSENTPSILPKQLAFITSDSEYKRAIEDPKLVQWNDVIELDTFTITNAYSAVAKHQSMQQELSIISEADFNGDNLQDILLISKETISTASYSNIRLFLLSRYSKSDDFVLLLER